MTVGTDGFGLISYYDGTNADLKVAHCTDTACTAATTTTLDSTGNVGPFTSVTVGTDGFGLISYWDNTNLDLKVAHCTNTACSAATTTTLDSAGDVGTDTSVTVGTDGFGLISYFDRTNGDLKVAHCTNTACTRRDDDDARLGRATSVVHTSVTVGTDGFGLISYYDLTNGDLKVAHCTNTACTRRDDDDARLGRERRYAHVGDGRHGRLRPDQLLRLDERRPEGRALHEHGLQRRDDGDARLGRERRCALVAGGRCRRPRPDQLLGRHERRSEGAHCANTACTAATDDDARLGRATSATTLSVTSGRTASA